MLGEDGAIASLRPMLKINAAHFFRLLTILIENAIKYTPQGGTITIEYVLRGCLEVRISDTGIGIEKKYLPKIFDRFYRVDSARTEASDGIGLGLPIAKWLAELYGGKILIESEIDHGTIVTVRFPSI